MTRYCRPTSRAEALEALAQEDGHGWPLVGGTDLIVGMRHHQIEPSLVVDLKGITDFAPPITVTDEGVAIGPTFTMGALSRHPVVCDWYPALVEAAVLVGSVAIRNRASLIGNACNASPGADTIPALLLYDVRATIESLHGERTVKLTDFFLGPRRTQCAKDELVTRLEIAKPMRGSSSAFVRLARRRGVDLATVSVAAAVDRRDEVRLGLGAVGPRALQVRFRAPLTPTDEPALVETLDRHLAVARPISDLRGSKEYRLGMLRVLARRAVITAAQRRDEGVPA